MTFDPRSGQQAYSAEDGVAASVPADDAFAPAPRLPSPQEVRTHRGTWVTRALAAAAVLLFVVASLMLGVRLWLTLVARASLPRIDGRLTMPGLTHPVTVRRDAHGVPYIRAASMDDLVTAQAFVTAQDRLFQLDLLRRHAAGELAEVLGLGLLEHDRTQRILQMRAAADRAFAALPADQRHWLDRYADGVNAAIAAQAAHLPLEFRLLGYAPRPWLPRDCVLIGLIMYQDLTTGFPAKLDREALIARLDPSLPAETRALILSDLYPVGSWRDHPPSQPAVDLTRPVDSIPDIPLDDTQVHLSRPTPPASHADDLLALTERLSPACDYCRPGSNNWVVTTAHTATGTPLLANDMHLTLGVPELWYQVDLSAPSPQGAEPFHVAGVSLPGTPFVIMGHNAHLAWGFTSLGADVQDLTIEHLRGSPAPGEFATPDRSWRPLLHQRETIRIRGQRSVVLDVLATQHGGTATPIISPLLRSETRALALHWTIYDESNVSLPFFSIDSASSAAALLEAFARFGGPGLNLVYADDANHIGYHAIGRTPIRGSVASPAPLSPVPTDVLDADAPAHEWAGYIPFDQLPQIADPPDGILATANARITPDDYRFPMTLDWPDPYRNERIWKLLSGRNGLTPADMLAIQTDIFSEPDRLIARRLAYALDHATGSTKRRRDAADLLRAWDGRVLTSSSAAAITYAARVALWPILLTSKLTVPSIDAAPSSSQRSTQRTQPQRQPWELYRWSAKAFAEEQIITHAPARWLPPHTASWDDLLAEAVDRGLVEGSAPPDLGKWRFGQAHPVELTHPLFAQSWLLRALSGFTAGTGLRPQSGNGTTIKQVGRTFGPSERFTAVVGDWDQSTLNIAVGQSGNPISPWFLDQFPGWLAGTTRPMAFSDAAVERSVQHTLVLEPQH